MTVVIPNSPRSMNPCWRVKPIAASGHRARSPPTRSNCCTRSPSAREPELHFITKRDDIASVATIFAAADRARYLTPRLHAEMVSELRWPGDPGPDTGIDVLSLELDRGDLAVIDILKRPDVMAHLAHWNAGAVLGADSRQRVLASSAIGVISVSGSALTDFARGGSAAEAVWITAQQCGLAVQPISPVFLYARNINELAKVSGSFADELGELSEAFRRLARTPPDSFVALVLRFTFSGPASVRSRRCIERVRLL